MSEALYSLRGVTVRYGAHAALSIDSLGLSARSLTAVTGPNGAGKSTLLGVLAGLRADFGGECNFEGREVRRIPRRVLARSVSFVPQSVSAPFPFTAEQVVYMGRTPFREGLFESPADHAAVDEAIRLTDTQEFRHRDFRTLSGGERQRVVLAAALAQKPRVLLLDEPSTFLDVRHQLDLYRLLASLADAGLLVVTVTHELNLAMAFATRVLVLHAGRMAADGPPAEALTRETVGEVFRVDASIEPGPGGQPRIHYV